MSDKENRPIHPDLGIEASATRTGLSLKAKGAGFFVLLAIDIVGIVVIGYQLAQKDFIVAAELPEVGKIHMDDEIRYFYVNDDFVIIPTRRDFYLVEFRGTCYQLRSRYWTSDMIDIRVTKRLLYAKFDTIRGCVVGRIYELSEPQLEELRYLGDAPGEGQFIDTP